ncbi:MAG: helix-turn-helix domain-containing protein, partial [Candidatus Sulfotelmatobacter sp.]
LNVCQNYSWPGNLKELETFVKRYLIAGDEELTLSGLESGSRMSSSDLHRQPPSLLLGEREEMDAGEAGPLPKSLKSMIQSVRWETERNAIAAALEKTGWNRKAAARLLGVSYRTILYKIEQYHMSASESYLSSLSGARLSVSSQNKGNGKAS